VEDVVVDFVHFLKNFRLKILLAALAANSGGNAADTSRTNYGSPE
jgi:hypothetical protein